MARPKKEAPDLRCRQVTVRFSADEYASLAGLAKSVGIPLADYCRRSALKKAINFVSMPDVSKEAYIELSRIGNNLNQITRKLNEGGEITRGDIVNILALQEAVRTTQRDIISHQ